MPRHQRVGGAIGRAAADGFRGGQHLVGADATRERGSTRRLRRQPAALDGEVGRDARGRLQRGLRRGAAVRCRCHGAIATGFCGGLRRLAAAAWSPAHGAGRRDRRRRGGTGCGAAAWLAEFFVVIAQAQHRQRQQQQQPNIQRGSDDDVARGASLVGVALGARPASAERRRARLGRTFRRSSAAQLFERVVSPKSDRTPRCRPASPPSARQRSSSRGAARLLGGLRSRWSGREARQNLIDHRADLFADSRRNAAPCGRSRPEELQLFLQQRNIVGIATSVPQPGHYYRAMTGCAGQLFGYCAAHAPSLLRRSAECCHAGSAGRAAKPGPGHATPLSLRHLRPELFRGDTLWPWFERLRQEDPVPAPRRRAYWSVTKHKDIIAVDSNHRVFSSDLSWAASPSSTGAAARADQLHLAGPARPRSAAQGERADVRAGASRFWNR